MRRPTALISPIFSLIPAVASATPPHVAPAPSPTAAMGPTRAAAVELLKSEDKLEFTMRAQSTNRDSIMSRGFLNQYDVGTSRGMLNPAYRATVEASLLGVSKEEYAQLPNSIRPKYGYLRPAKETGVTIPGYDAASHFGEDIFVFKHDAVKDHLTVYPTDSLGQSAGSAAPSQWYHAMLPWADRMLLAPQMDLKSDVHQLQIAGSPAPPGFQARPGASYSTYLEIQIWRPIGLPEIERFEFQSVPPSGEFLKALRRNGAKIFQVGQPAEWHGDAPPTTTSPTSFVFFHSLSKAA